MPGALAVHVRAETLHAVMCCAVLYLLTRGGLGGDTFLLAAGTARPEPPTRQLWLIGRSGWVSCYELEKLPGDSPYD